MRQKRFWFTITGILAVLGVALMLPAGAGAASKYKILYKFSGGTDGSVPLGDLILDKAGNLYGTTAGGGGNSSCSCGTVFQLTPNSDGSWTEHVLHSFAFFDGEAPVAGLVFDGQGNLYGTTQDGGPNNGGTVFKLAPNSDGSWTESVLYDFCSISNCADGAYVNAGLIFDSAGNLFGTTSNGGTIEQHGTVFKLTPNVDGSWTEDVLYAFKGTHDGSTPHGSLIFDTAGNLYGTTHLGGAAKHGVPKRGTVFQLTPHAGESWTESILHRFSGRDGGRPDAGLILDGSGNLYGTTLHGGVFGNGTVFELTRNAEGKWTERVLHTFANHLAGSPHSSLIFDPNGNLYGTAWGGGPADAGAVFKLTPNSIGGWAYSVLHVFNGKPAMNPFGGLVLDQAGNLYGTTFVAAKTAMVSSLKSPRSLAESACRK